jgi:hypothetical protein
MFSYFIAGIQKLKYNIEPKIDRCILLYFYFLYY